MTRLDGWIGGWVSWAPPFTSQSLSSPPTTSNHIMYLYYIFLIVVVSFLWGKTSDHPRRVFFALFSAQNSFHSKNVSQGWILKILALFRFATKLSFSCILSRLDSGKHFWKSYFFSMNKIIISYIFFNKISYLATLQTVLPSHSIPWALVTWTYKVTQMYALHNMHILMHTRFALKSILLMVFVSSTVPLDFYRTHVHMASNFCLYIQHLFYPSWGP